MAKDDWKIENGWLCRKVQLSNFMACVGLVNEIAELAEKAQHHPDIKLYDYKNLRIELQTHDTSSITEKDHDLAAKIDQLIAEL